MNASKLSPSSITGILFILACVVAVAGGIMYMGRNQLGWALAQTRRYLEWERTAWISGILLSASACWQTGWRAQTTIFCPDWLVVLAGAGDPYYPILFFVAPLIIGITLLGRAP